MIPNTILEITANGARFAYPQCGRIFARELISAWLLDDVDRDLVPRVESLGIRCAATDTIMVDDDRAEAVARAALALLT